MSIQNYSNEFREFISLKTKFINDELFQSNEDIITNPEIIENYIEMELSNEEISCLFFYLSFLIKVKIILNNIINYINNKFKERNIKAREMPDIHYLIVYKISEEKFLEENINKIKNYFEDYLLQLKEAEENEKILKEQEEEIRIKEQKEKELRERFILPTINNFELMEINENSLIVTVPLYEEKEIINKNIYNISYCEENMQKKN